MKYVREIGLVSLAAIAGLLSAVPVPPFAPVGELASIAVAFTLFAALLFLPQLRPRRLSLGLFVTAVIPLRLLAELLWELAPSYLPHSFFFLTRALGADGEGAYNTDTYQVFLILVLLVLIVTVSMKPNGVKWCQEPCVK